jgi:hypothetical protein
VGKAAAILLLGTPTTSTAELLAQAAVARGLEVRRVAGPDDLDGISDRAAYWYGGPSAASRVARRLGIGLLEPGDGLLPQLGRQFTGRRVELATLADAWLLAGPAFVKPPSDKSFPAQVYQDGMQVRQHSEELTPSTPVLISDVVSFAREYRLFLLDGGVAAASRYAVYGRLDAAPLDGDLREGEVRAFAATLAEHASFLLPSAVVVDIGLACDPETGHERWAVVEANMAWFANCYSADPGRVLDVVLRSAGPVEDVATSDVVYLCA